MTATQTVPSVPAALGTQFRAIAAWLDSHPEFRPHFVDVSVTLAGPIRLQQYGVPSLDDACARAVEMGWPDYQINHAGERDEMFKLQSEVAPGIVAELLGRRAA